MENEETQIAKPKWTIHGALEQQAEQIDKALADSIPREQFLRICATVWQTGGTRMHKADFRSFIVAVVEAAQLGLNPDKVLGECYFIPRKSDGKLMVNFQIGYRGAMKLARRGGEVTDIQPEVVYQNDDFTETMGTDRKIHHVRWYSLGHDEPGDIIAAYATARMRDGWTSFRTVHKAEIDRAAKSSGNPFNDSPSNVWRDHYEAMAMKTAVLRLCKFLPIPDDAKRAIIREEYRDAGVPEHSITVEAVDEESAHIANLRQDPKEIERVALAKSKLSDHAAKKSAFNSAWRALKLGADSERFFKAAGCERSEEVLSKFVRHGAAIEEWPGDVEAQTAAVVEATAWLMHLGAGEQSEYDSCAYEFGTIINGPPDFDRSADRAFEASLEAGK